MRERASEDTAPAGDGTHRHCAARRAAHDPPAGLRPVALHRRRQEGEEGPDAAQTRCKAVRLRGCNLARPSVPYGAAQRGQPRNAAQAQAGELQEDPPPGRQVQRLRRGTGSQRAPVEAARPVVAAQRQRRQLRNLEERGAGGGRASLRRRLRRGGGRGGCNRCGGAAVVPLRGGEVGSHEVHHMLREKKASVHAWTAERGARAGPPASTTDVPGPGARAAARRRRACAAPGRRRAAAPAPPGGGGGAGRAGAPRGCRECGAGATLHPPPPRGAIWRRCSRPPHAATPRPARCARR